VLPRSERRITATVNHSLLRQMAAQKQEKHSSKNEKYTQLHKKN